MADKKRLTAGNRRKLGERITRLFRKSFEEHPCRYSDPALAIESAKETAARKVPVGVYGRFDAEALTFMPDG